MKDEARQADPTQGLERPPQSTRFVQSPWLTVAEGARYLHMRAATFREKVASGEVPSYRRDKTTFVNTQELDAWMRGLPSGAAPIAMVAKSRQGVA